MNSAARAFVWIALAATFAACAAELPSTTPLGKGPKWHAEEKARAEREAAAADAGDAATDPTKEPAKKPAVAAKPPAKPTGEADAGSEQEAGAAKAAAEDAGAADAGAAKPNITAWLGSYTGSDTSKVRMGPFPERTETDPNAKLRVEKKDDKTLLLTAVASNTGQDICTLEASLQPDGSATIASGQECFGSGSGGPMTGTVRSGKATLSGGKLVLDMIVDLEAKAGGQTITGELEYHFEGTK